MESTDTPRIPTAVLVMGGVALILANLPWLLAWLAPGSDRVFTGALLNWEDTNSYLAEIRQGIDGDWLYRDRYTSEPHGSGPLFVVYLLVGRIAGVLGIGPVVAMMLARLGSGAVLLAVVWGAIGAWLPQQARVPAFAMTAFASGLGWLVAFVPGFVDAFGWPVDLWVPESNTFFALLTFPHFALAMAAFVGALWGWSVAFETGSTPPAVLAATAAFLLAWIHPFDLPVLFGTITGFTLVRAVRERQFPWLEAAVVLPAAVLSGAVVTCLRVLVIGANPVFSAWVAQGLMEAHNPVVYVVGFGGVAAFAVFGFASTDREAPGTLLLGVWVAVQSALLLAPHPLSGRFVEGLHLPLAMLAGIGWCALQARIPGEGLVRSLVRVGAIAMLLPSTALVWAQAVGPALSQPSPHFVSAGEADALRWLDAHTDRRSVVLAAYGAGNRIPAWTGARVYYGHWHQTVDVDRKGAEVERFYATGDPADLPADVDFVWVGPEERALGSWEALSGWRLVLDTPEVRIWAR